jgi:sigma-B regulation protein RsbU (phosphoserine phosphatase)
MLALVADDDPVHRRLLQATLRGWGHEVVLAADGREAWELFLRHEQPLLALLDWSMPEIDGLELCRRFRALPGSDGHPRRVHAVLVTARSDRADVLRALEAGADDYLTKPVDRQELCARLQVGVRLLTLQQSLADRVSELESALSRVKQLHGLLPICCYCKSIRTDENYWQQVEHYIAAHSELQFSHGICPGCYHKVVVPQIEAARPAAAR